MYHLTEGDSLEVGQQYNTNQFVSADQSKQKTGLGGAKYNTLRFGDISLTWQCCSMGHATEEEAYSLLYSSCIQSRKLPCVNV